MFNQSNVLGGLSENKNDSLDFTPGIFLMLVLLQLLPGWKLQESDLVLVELKKAV